MNAILVHPKLNVKLRFATFETSFLVLEKIVARNSCRLRTMDGNLLFLRISAKIHLAGAGLDRWLRPKMGIERYAGPAEKLIIFVESPPRGKEQLWFLASAGRSITFRSLQMRRCRC